MLGVSRRFFASLLLGCIFGVISSLMMDIFIIILAGARDETHVDFLLMGVMRLEILLLLRFVVVHGWAICGPIRSQNRDTLGPRRGRLLQLLSTFILLLQEVILRDLVTEVFGLRGD